MRWRAVLVVAAVLSVGGGCAVMHPPVAVEVAPGTPDLDGVWQGTYESRETGRVGDIYLALSARGDSAAGEVVMAPRGTEIVVRSGDDRWRWDGVPRSQVLTIRFVRVVGGEVVGELDPYRDPDCGCLLRTTFRGEVEGDTVVGTFASQAEHPTHDAEGTWQARRSRSPR